ncbi:hypothetical protein ACFUKV_15060 [Streptomyces paradoxus]|uniref:hypothetical protein n=1 Tax=Streptomyces paradoxus TaxID=66375 RepID=UPI0036444914
MTARNDDDRRHAERDGGAEYDGMDALMAVLTGDPLPEEARRDTAFMAAHDSAAADVALLVRQLGLLGDALAGADGPRAADPGAPGAAVGSQVRASSARPEPNGVTTARTDGDAGGASPVSAGFGSVGAPAVAGGGDAGGESPVSLRPEPSGLPAQRRDADGVSPVSGVSAGFGSVGAPAVAGDGDAGGVSPGSARSGPGGVVVAAGGESGEGSAVTSLSSRRRTRPKAVDVALKGLVAAAAAGLVIGMGWLVVQSGGRSAGGDQGASSAADSSVGREHADEDAKLSNAGYLACARIVAEGTVAEVESVPGTGQDRITLDVTRYYKPDKGRAQITFPLETGAVPSLRAGDHMLVGVSGDQAHPDTWATGEKEIARERAWITDALPASRTLPCP